MRVELATARMLLGTFPDGIDKPLLAQGVLAAVVAYWTLWIIYARWFHPLACFPGLFWASITRAWTVLHVLPGDAEKAQKKLHERYGSVLYQVIVFFNC